jgi:alpha,alpha-trehalase
MNPSRRPIEGLGFLSDLHSSVLVDTTGSVVWAVFPRFDSRSVFAALLDDGAGHWRMCPAVEAEVSRRYRGRSLVLETTFTTPTGTLVVTDALGLGSSEEGHLLGSGAPHALLREARCEAGEVEVVFEYVPRPEYARAYPLLVCGGGRVGDARQPGRFAPVVTAGSGVGAAGQCGTHVVPAAGG